MKTIIMAGGKGTRISSVSSDIPKPMINVAGKPVLQHQIECLKRQGISNITIIVGHLGEQIKDYFNSGKEFNVSIEYIIEDEPLGTAGALYYFKDTTEDILLINGDLCFDIDIKKFYLAHLKFKADITLFTHPNSHPYDSTLIETDKDNRVIKLIKKEDTRGNYKNRVNAGIHLLSPSIFCEYKGLPKKLDLDRDIIQKMINTKRVYVYDSPEYVKDMGTPERYYNVCNDFILGRVQCKNLNYKQKAIFLDRDGTINIYKNFLHKPNEIELLPEAAEAIRLINQSDYLTIIITNQPVVARGECSLEELEEIHKRMETLLGEQGAYIDDLFFCPHHPDRGFPGENVQLKVNCECRKPKPGMFFEAANKYNIDLSKSFMIGDSSVDIEAGNNAGCTSILLENGLTIQCINNILGNHL